MPELDRLFEALLAQKGSDLHIAALREEFMDFCDHLNLDAVIEPIRG